MRRPWITLGRVVTAAIIIVLTVLNTVDRSPDVGTVFHPHRYGPEELYICVEGVASAGCRSVSPEVYRNCLEGSRWEDGQCYPRIPEPDWQVQLDEDEDHGAANYWHSRGY